MPVTLPLRESEIDDDFRSFQEALLKELEGLDPLTRIQVGVMWLLKGVFGDLDKGSYQWDDDPNVTEIYIDADFLTEDRRNGAKPSIVVKLGNDNTMNLGMDQRTDVKIQTADRNHLDMDTVGVIVSAYSSAPAEARKLAWLCSRIIRRYKRIMSNIIGIEMIGEPVSVSPVYPSNAPGTTQPEASGRPMYECDAIIPMFFADKWTAEVLGKIPLSQVELQYKVGEPPHRDTLLPPRIPNGEFRKPVDIRTRQIVEF